MANNSDSINIHFEQDDTVSTSGSADVTMQEGDDIDLARSVGEDTFKALIVKMHPKGIIKIWIRTWLHFQIFFALLLKSKLKKLQDKDPHHPRKPRFHLSLLNKILLLFNSRMSHFLSSK